MARHCPAACPRPDSAAIAGAALEQVHIAQEAIDKRAGRVVPDLLRRAFLLDLALVDDHHAVGHFQRLFLVVGHEDGGHMQLVVQAAQPAAQLLAHLGVQRAEGLVQQQHLGLDRQRAGQGDALALAARELRGKRSAIQSSCTSLSSFITFSLICASLGRSLRGLTRRPKATFSNTVMWRNSA
jgi:hypothetical protein